jgi:hypothetical protein
MMKVIAFLALFALAANAFNFTLYHQGVDAQLGLNETVVEEGITCINALSANFEQVAAIMESKNFDTIAEELGSQIEQIKYDFNTTCLPYYIQLAMNFEHSIGTWNMTVWKQTFHQNFELYLPQIIQQVAQWVQLLEAGQDFQAGEIQGYINQILVGAVKPSTIEVAPATTMVAFNHSKFFSEYFSTIFQALGIQSEVDVDSLIQCSSNLDNTTATFVYIKEQFSTFDFEQKLNATQYLVSLSFDTIRNCEGAAAVGGLILVPQYEAFKEDPVAFTLEVLERIALDMPQYIASIQKQNVDIQEGNYVAAAQEKVKRINNDFQGLVNYTISN